MRLACVSAFMCGNGNSRDRIPAVSCLRQIDRLFLWIIVIGHLAARSLNGNAVDLICGKHLLDACIGILSARNGNIAVLLDQPVESSSYDKAPDHDGDRENIE